MPVMPRVRATMSADQQQQHLTMIWLAMTLALPIYIALKLMIVRPGPPGSPWLGRLCVLIGAAAYPAAWLVFQQGVGQLQAQATPTSLQRLSDDAKLALQMRAQSAVIMCLGLLETPVILGLVSALLRSPAFPAQMEWMAALSLAGACLLKARGLPAVHGLLKQLEIPMTGTR